MSETPHTAPDAGIDWWAMLSDPAFLEQPYGELCRLQRLGPVHFDAASGVYFVLGHEAFSRVVKSSRMGRDTRLWRDGWATPEYRERDPLGHRLFSEFHAQMINANPPDHGRMRGVYECAFKPRPTKALEPMIVEQAHKLLAAMPERGEVEMIQAYAGPMPLRVLCELFDMPPAMDDQISRWSDALIRIGDIMISQAQKREALSALTEFKDYLRGHLAERREAPGESLMDMAIRANDEGVLNEEETLVNLVAMLIAGHETTVTLIGNGLMLLLRHPEQLQRLRAQRELMRTAIEEFLRYEPGGNMVLRVAIEDFQLGDVRIPAGAPVIGLIGAVNRDPARFERPDELDLARRSNAHFTFGGGAHFCIGAPLARLEADIAFNALLDRYSQLELAGAPQWRLDRMNARGLARLPVRVGGES
ncbi:cytochrome P450 [Alkalilimnicola sp. S0819]|uniref:cytochrome P450 n=1 Tax=Alkalilimnicola sp. S0819 TaxID=2613922 RepID=UPI00126237B9|nr:cytochrome P450 [Alkalilimnicola sp. S0819]KAB7619602.1 cytochrome P450 [Alkalilimnicola sp. S0819]MPQ17606.1 cytochrome P450 [Alkalilimnicola sp. S0819]